MARKQFVIIGLGRFGTSVAETLYKVGHEVMVIDKDEDLIQDISDKVTHAVQLDATDENALRSLGLRNFDVAVVTIGSNIQASVMATLLVKEHGVKYIIAKGNSDLHAKVLYKIGADRVILPEKDMGVRVAHNLVSESIIDFIELSPDYSIMEIQALKEWKNKTVRELKLRSRYGINVMAIKNGNDINLSPSPEDIIHEKDVLVAIGSAEDLNKLEGMIIKLN